MTGILAVDAQGLRQLSKDLRKIGDKELSKQLRSGLKKSGEIVAASARSKSSWSARIPGSIRVVVQPKGVAVRAGGKTAPHAITFEGKNNGEARRHPVFARGDRSDWTWAPQDPRPFLKPALASNLDKVVQVVGDELEVAFLQNGFTRGFSPKGQR